MWRILSNCSRFVFKQHKLQSCSDKIGQLTQISTTTKPQTNNNNDDNSYGITFKIDKKLSSSSSSSSPENRTTKKPQETKRIRTKSTSSLSTNNKLNYYKFDYYDYLCTFLGINSLLKFGYKDKLKVPNFKINNNHDDNDDINNKYNNKCFNNIKSNDYSNDSQKSSISSIRSIKILNNNKNNIMMNEPDNNNNNNNNNLDDLFNKFKRLNEETMGKLENMIALQKLSECKYEEAIPYLRIASEKGYSKAAFNLGLCYQDGLGVVRDEKMAFTYFKLAAVNNHSDAAYNCAMYCLKYTNTEMCIHYLRIAVKNNDKMDLAKKLLASLLINHEEKYEEAFNLLTSITEIDSEVEYYLGLCYENGYGVKISWCKALEYYEKSMKNGNKDAKIKFFELQSKQLFIENSNEQRFNYKNNKKKLGHFTHSIGQFEFEINNKKLLNKQTSTTMTLKTSYSSSQLGLLLNSNKKNGTNEMKIMNNHKKSNHNLIYVY